MRASRWLAALALTACGPRDEACLPGEDPTFVIGAGQNAFEATTPGDPAELVFGPQGGHHTWTGLQATHLDASEPWDVVFVGMVDGLPLGSAYPLVEPRCNPTAHALEAWGITLVWDADPSELVGKTAEVTGTLTDAAGTELTATTTLQFTDDE